MEAYRDQYATLFNNGRNVVVIGISVDADTTLASWARESSFPILFASDTARASMKAYGVFNTERGLDTRALFVIAPHGRVAYRTPSFRVTTQEAYQTLGAVIDSLAPPPADSTR